MSQLGVMYTFCVKAETTPNFEIQKTDVTSKSAVTFVCTRGPLLNCELGLAQQRKQLDRGVVGSTS
jgi:hypothetical protein